eukprot:8945108-Pyramimonas_sp.AAC.1
MIALCMLSTVASIRLAVRWPVRCWSWLRLQLTSSLFGPGSWSLTRPGFFRARALRSEWCGP